MRSRRHNAPPDNLCYSSSNHPIGRRVQRLFGGNPLHRAMTRLMPSLILMQLRSYELIFLDYKEMLNTKDEIRKLLDRLPDDASWEDVQYSIYVRERINRGRRRTTNRCLIKTKSKAG